ncbi:hypothetical protein AB0C76_29980 [Kitasatospora sp. NPDC048722]|uniref:hypothetical protein n=1 Tax=Kitasatospora sp. NPDC048722 TaxID=3155639 RepID=UPI003403A3C6
MGSWPNAPDAPITRSTACRRSSGARTTCTTCSTDRESSHLPLEYQAFVDRATADPDVVGLVLKGSHAHEGMATEHSDPLPGWDTDELLSVIGRIQRTGDLGGCSAG